MLKFREISGQSWGFWGFLRPQRVKEYKTRLRFDNFLSTLPARLRSQRVTEYMFLASTALCSFWLGRFFQKFQMVVTRKLLQLLSSYPYRIYSTTRSMALPIIDVPTCLRDEVSKKNYFRWISNVNERLFKISKCYNSKTVVNSDVKLKRHIHVVYIYDLTNFLTFRVTSLLR